MLWWKRLKPDDPEKREKLKDQIEYEGGLDKTDPLAMVLSALLVIVPVCLIVLLVICAICLLPLLLF